MKIILSEWDIRHVVAEAFKISGKQGSSSYTRKTSSNSSAFDSGNFEYEDVADQSPAVRAKAELSDWGGKKKQTRLLKKNLNNTGPQPVRLFQERQNKQSKINHPGVLRLYLCKVRSFFKSAAHITWKEAAEANTKAINANPVKFAGKEMYIALPIDGNTKINIGDNVWRPRDGGSHSDIVVGANKVIGGNLDNTVKSGPIAHDLVIKK